MSHTRTYTRAALREIDRRAAEQYGIPVLTLMENAGRAVAESALCQAPKRTLILTGPGNNGGDGLVAARHLYNQGIAVLILLTAPHDHFKNAAESQLKTTTAMNIPTEVISPGHAELRDWLVDSASDDLIIDAIFGTGLSRPVEGLPAEIIDAANHAHRPILAVDIPSGLDCDTGQPLGTAIRATRTLSFCGLKKGFTNARAFTGKVTIADIGAPRELLDQLSGS